MKPITSSFLFFLFLVGWFTPIIAQHNSMNCSKVINSVEYSSLLNRLKIAPNDNEKLILAKISLDKNCFTTQQVKELALTFLDDNYKSEFVIEIHPKTINNHNFYEVYDAFMSFSTVLRLHDYFALKNDLKQDTSTAKTTESKTLETPSKITFPNLNYPSVYQYNGERLCEKPLDENTFMGIAQQIQSQNGKDFNQLSVASIASSSYCLSTEQAMKLSTLINNEDFRYNYLTKAYPSVFDNGNMKNAGLVFKTKTNLDKWTNFIVENITDTNTKKELSNAVVVKCEVSADEFKGILESVNQIAFETTKINHTKIIIEAKKCFTANQIAQIMKQFSFERSMVEIAKFAYDYCIDTDNYFKLNNELTHSSSKEELIKFTQSKKK
jgi:hypothetical protein